MIFHQFFTQGFMGIGGAEKNAVGNNAGALSAFFSGYAETGQGTKVPFFVLVTAFKLSFMLSASTVPLKGGFARHTVKDSERTFCLDKLS